MEQYIKNALLEAITIAAAQGLFGTPTAISTTPNKWRDAQGIADYLGFTPQWVRTHMMHLAHRPGGSDPRWNTEEVDQWVRTSQAAAPTAQSQTDISVSKRSRNINHN